MTGGDGLAGPVVSGTARLKENRGGLVLGEELGELGPRERYAHRTVSLLRCAAAAQLCR